MSKILKLLGGGLINYTQPSEDTVDIKMACKLHFRVLIQACNRLVNDSCLL